MPENSAEHRLQDPISQPSEVKRVTSSRLSRVLLILCPLVVLLGVVLLVALPSQFASGSGSLVTYWLFLYGAIAATALLAIGFFSNLFWAILYDNRIVSKRHKRKILVVKVFTPILVVGAFYLGLTNPLTWMVGLLAVGLGVAVMSKMPSEPLEPGA